MVVNIMDARMRRIYGELTARKRLELYEEKGDRCIYCGRPATDLHHIIPVCMGGDNRASNIVPLCYNCHGLVHMRRNTGTPNKRGRKRIERPDNFLAVVDEYLDGIISLAHAVEKLGLCRNVFYRMLDEYRAETGDMRNHRANGIVRDGRVCI